MKTALLAIGMLGALTSQAQSFGPVTTYNMGYINYGYGTFPQSVAVGDVTNDGLPDLVVGSNSSVGIAVLAGRPGGIFAPPIYYPVPSAGLRLVLGDVNGDGRVDIVGEGGHYGVYVLLQANNGFAPAQFYTTSTSVADPHDLALGDVDNDGQLDLVVANNYSADVSVLRGQIGGGFGVIQRYPVGPDEPFRVVMADLNCDGWLDIVAAPVNANIVRVLSGQGGGSFGAAATVPANSSALFTESVAVGDLNHDARLDLVLTGQNGQIGVLLGQAIGGFAPLITYSSGAGTVPGQVQVGDVNSDGWDDVVTANNGSGNITVLLGQTTGLGAPMLYAAGGTASGIGRVDDVNVVLADVTGDGQVDLITTNGNANVVGVAAGLVAPPTLVALGGISGPVGGRLSLTGANLLGATQVLFAGSGNNIVTSGFTISADGRQITGVQVPSGAQTGLVRVFTSRGTLVSSLPFQVVSSPLAARQPAAETVALYPNPAHGTTTVQLPAGPAATLTLLDALGRVVRTAVAPAGIDYPLSLAGLAPGVYALRVQAGEAQAVRQVVVE